MSFAHLNHLGVLDLFVCPVCGDTYLHQRGVILCSRIGGEDRPTRFVKLDDDGLPVLAVGYENPSSRRDGLLIEFECETCHWYDDENPNQPEAPRPAPYLMAIYQHKGQTFIHWQVDRQLIRVKVEVM